MTDAISTTGLGRSYGAMVALHPLTMTVAKGEVFGFLGHNGAGKTTTIQLLTTLARPTTGRASVAGHDILSDGMAVRRSIGYVPENVRLYDTFTTHENLLFFAHLSAVDNPADRVAETLDFLGIADLAARRVGEFSKGMRQRVGLAQAILHRPAVLFLDEPTSGLDPMGVKLLRRVIERLNADGMTIFMNTHLLGEVARTCTSIGILSHGRLVFQDRIDTVNNLYGDEQALEALYLSVLPEAGRAA
ncbi:MULTISPECIES: ABC transporter ATP-binding protein [Paracoccaceae]|uniref:ATP-binding cassette domain-containing protein n=1 Tax=Paracoccus shanxieyensis TaxID=2675752 RepID=A0A6L6J002_9RHOB|nr:MULTISPECIES: ABC transporter ATP-binding protein [Paracoccaceae]MTH66126.1 ATP-binding cassette domain-containing protein [Paracoccus shanxieyensis]MTH89361.1 ATP-binding cassette domain-containing protein [Paracoccus shanxieyensis]QBJ26483.1 ABC transporter ATP-binding protein [Haematobacter massiliensis]